jgi:ATP-dependent RNA helicase DDX60
MVKDILDRGSISPAVSSILSSVLIALGFTQYLGITTSTNSPSGDNRPLSFPFIKLIKTKTKAPLYEYMHIKENPIIWQLRLFGEFMDRSMDSKPDPRVAFEPDGWQREVLDAIDQNGSLLVVGRSFLVSFFLRLLFFGTVS